MRSSFSWARCQFHKDAGDDCFIFGYPNPSSSGRLRVGRRLVLVVLGIWKRQRSDGPRECHLLDDAAQTRYRLETLVVQEPRDEVAPLMAVLPFDLQRVKFPIVPADEFQSSDIVAVKPVDC